MMCEQSIIGARASVMVYDDVQKKWIPSGSSSGLSKVQIFYHQQNNTFRVVGRKLQDHEVVINCAIIKGLKYNQATATFHQWRDSKFVYGLNFSSPQDAEAFARAMMHALDVLSGRVPPPSGMQTTNPNPNQMAAYEEDMGYRTMTREDAAIMQQQQQMTSQPPGVGPPQPPPITIPGPGGGGGILSPQTPTSQTLPSQATQQQQTHHRTNRTRRSSSGMASMMDEMAKTLARRRAQAEKKEPDSNDDAGASGSRQRAWEKSSTLPHKLGSSSSSGGAGGSTGGGQGGTSSLSGSESPKPARKRFGSASEETILKQINGGDSFSLPTALELENLKEDILREMRSEIAKAKQEIIKAIRVEFNNRR
ncbi:protein enabled [Anopheles cruzii]|uniref:protein enabled n=1 Tax=Anopheles cruzii TaxID=68878 RepID=UPI0022EC5585|nr:protein enabled [Anopheles cruzii]